MDVLTGDGTSPRWFVKKRINTSNTHGTGCTLSSAIASHIAKGFDLVNSIEKSKEYIQSAIETGADLGLGRGRGPVNHLWQIKGVVE